MSTRTYSAFKCDRCGASIGHNGANVRRHRTVCKADMNAEDLDALSSIGRPSTVAERARARVSGVYSSSGSGGPVTLARAQRLEQRGCVVITRPEKNHYGVRPNRSWRATITQVGRDALAAHEQKTLKPTLVGKPATASAPSCDPNSWNHILVRAGLRDAARRVLANAMNLEDAQFLAQYVMETVEEPS